MKGQRGIHARSAENKVGRETDRVKNRSRSMVTCPYGVGFPGGSDGEASACNAAKPASIEDPFLHGGREECIRLPEAEGNIGARPLCRRLRGRGCANCQSLPQAELFVRQRERPGLPSQVVAWPPRLSAGRRHTIIAAYRYSHNDPLPTRV